MKSSWRLPLCGLALAVVFLGAGTAVSLAQCGFPSTGSGRVITYSFDPTVTPAGTVLHVTVKFPGGSEGSEEIEVPTHWAGEDLHGVNNLHALSQGTAIGETPTSGFKTIRYPPSQEVVLGYDLIKDWTGPLIYPLQFHPVLMPQYFEINGSNGLVHPKLEPQAPVKVNFDWQKLPAGWALATSFGTTSGPEGLCQSYSGPWQGVEGALFAAGEFRIHRFEIRKQPAVLAIRGQWTFSDDEAIADIQKAVGIVRDFWHDDDFPYFLVTLKPYDTGKGSADGSAFTNAFWMYMSPPDSISSLLPMLVHESFHTWNPGRMGYLPEGSQTSLYWFSEGFTQYYAYLLAYRAGLMTLPAYIERINGYLRQCPSSADPYMRGPVIALWLDGEIRRKSHGRRSLANLMFDMLRGADKPLRQASILKTADRYLPAEARRELHRAVEPGGKMPAPNGAALGPCVYVATDQVSAFDLGFDFEASMAAHRVTSVRSDGPAFKAGLRDGQELEGWSVYNDKPDKKTAFHIRTTAGRYVIQYYPREMITAPQYHLHQKAYADNPDACRRQ
jgi:predicted metalloprotease with PDZ domain